MIILNLQNLGLVVGLCVEEEISTWVEVGKVTLAWRSSGVSGEFQIQGLVCTERDECFPLAGIHKNN